MTTSHRSSPLRLLPLLASLLLAVGCYEAGQFTTAEQSSEAA